MLAKKQEEQLEALASIADYVSGKEILEKKDTKELDARLDIVLADLNGKNKFFKRLL